MFFLENTYRSLRMLRVPYVISGSGKTVPEDTGTYPKSALVTTDTEIESQSMVDYLCSCGHKRIAFITSGDEEPVETTTDVNMDLSGVYAKYQAAGTATVNYDDMEIIKVSHDHGHDHGHGTGNAGGGIIEAE